MASQKHYEIQLLPNLCFTELMVITTVAFDEKVDIVVRSYQSLTFRDVSKRLKVFSFFFLLA